MDIIPRFSFTYNGEPFDLAGAKTTPTEYGSLYELPDGLGIELHRRDYPEYNAVGWMLWFENKSANESGLFSGLCDCDTTWWFGGDEKNPRVSVFETSGNLSYETYRHADQIAREYIASTYRLSSSFLILLVNNPYISFKTA